MQADPQHMDAVQLAWLQEHMGSLFARRLLRLVKDIARLVPASSQDPSHRFPQLAGSHLSPVGSSLVLSYQLGYTSYRFPQLAGSHLSPMGSFLVLSTERGVRMQAGCAHRAAQVPSAGGIAPGG